MNTAEMMYGDTIYLPNGEPFIIETPGELAMVKELFSHWGPETSTSELRRIADLRYQENQRKAMNVYRGI